jgi:hypothetical protein
MPPMPSWRKSRRGIPAQLRVSGLMTLATSVGTTVSLTRGELGNGEKVGAIEPVLVSSARCQDGNPGQMKDTNEHWRFEAGPAILGQKFESFELPCGLLDVEG